VVANPGPYQDAYTAFLYSVASVHPIGLNRAKLGLPHGEAIAVHMALLNGSGSWLLLVWGQSNSLAGSIEHPGYRSITPLVKLTCQAAPSWSLKIARKDAPITR
jgi:hypothetical protein